MVTCTFILGTVGRIKVISYLKINRSCVKTLYMGVILYGPSLALSQVTGLNIWLAVGSCGLVCTIYTSIVSVHHELRNERIINVRVELKL